MTVSPGAWHARSRGARRFRRHARAAALESAPVRPLGWPPGGARASGGEEREVWLALAAQDGQVDLDPRDPARLGEHLRLRLDHLSGEHAAAAGHGGVLAQAVEIARELLDRVDRADALDFDRDPAVRLVAAHEVHGPDVGR